MSLSTARTIDIHAHAVLPEIMGAAGVHGPELYSDPDGTPIFRIGEYRLRGVRYAGSPFMDPDVRLAAMDRAEIDFQLLSPNPLTYFHFIPAADAIAFCRKHNDAMAALVARYPDRLGGTATLPMQDIPAAIAELERAVRELGLLGAYIGTDLTITLDDPALDPFYAKLVELDVPLFLHPGPAGIDGPAAPLQLSCFELDIIAGFAAQETAAVATLIYGGVINRHPRLDVCISHGGGSIALLYGRLKNAVQKRKWVPEHLKPEGAFDAQLSRIWYDAHMHDPASLDLLVARVGGDRLVYGTNFAGWDAPDHKEDAPAGIDFTANARRLLRAR
jgi:aminocarboxymuconate-semialdehyde decarboxylase